MFYPFYIDYWLTNICFWASTFFFFLRGLPSGGNVQDGWSCTPAFMSIHIELCSLKTRLPLSRVCNCWTFQKWPLWSTLSALNIWRVSERCARLSINFCASVGEQAKGTSGHSWECRYGFLATEGTDCCFEEWVTTHLHISTCQAIHSRSLCGTSPYTSD